MTTISFEIDDEMIKHFGMSNLKVIIKKELAFQRFKILGKEIADQMQKSDKTNWKLEFEKIRTQAYSEYKKNRL